MSNLINCTPHPVNILDENEGTVKIYAASGILPRCSVETTIVGCIDVDGSSVNITDTTFGDVENLPLEEEGTLLIVSRLVLSACPDRSDLIVPNDVVRNEKGHVVGCRSFARS